MNTSRTGSVGRTGPDGIAPPRWDRLLHLLVAFALLTLIVGLYLSHKYVTIYVQSVTVNQQWTNRLHQCARLGLLAEGVNAPGNDVFQSHRIAAEERKMRAAEQAFNEKLAAFRDELQSDAAGAELLPELREFGRLMGLMSEEAGGLFSHLRNNQTVQAGERMAAMDRRYAQAHQALERCRRQIAAIQERRFEDQATAAGSLQRFQYVVSALILVMIAGSVAYGRRMNRQAEQLTREKEASIAALRDSEAQLDRRVRDRTAELMQANESLRKEVEDRRRAEEALRQSEARYRSLVEVRQQLLKKVMSAQEDERRRIARDLHDEIGQALTSLLIGLRTVADAVTVEMAHERAEDLRRIAVSTLNEVRRLARGLRPSVLDDLGLAAALERYAADYAQAHGVRVQVEAPDATGVRLPEEVETALYRIAQEALTNTAKHAAAMHVRIAVVRAPGHVQLAVSDDGRGFAGPNPDPAGRLGLSGMQERAALLNGTVAVESEPGAGTTVTVHIPVVEDSRGNDSDPAGG